LDVGVIGGQAGGDRAPEPRAAEDVGLVDRSQALLAAAGELEADADDALDFGFGVEEGVDSLAAARRLPDAAGLADGNTAGELADDNQVDALEDFRLEAGAIDQGREERDRAQVGEEAEPLAQAEERLLRPHRRLGVIPIRPADRAEEDG